MPVSREKNHLQGYGFLCGIGERVLLITFQILYELCVGEKRAGEGIFLRKEIAQIYERGKRAI